MKYKVKLRYQIAQSQTEKISFHLEERIKFVLGKNTPGFKLDHPSIDEKQCSLSVEDGQLYVTDEGGPTATLLNHQKVRSRPVHVGDILEFGECSIEFLEVPFIQKTEEVAQTMFLDLSQKPEETKRAEPKPVSQAVEIPQAARVSEKVPVTTREPIREPAHEPAQETDEYAHLSKSQRKKKLRKLKRKTETARTTDPSTDKSYNGDKAYAPEVPKNFHEPKPKLPSYTHREKASELARRQAEQLKKVLETETRSSINTSGNTSGSEHDGITDKLELPPHLKAKFEQKFVKSFWMQVGLGATLPLGLFLVYLLFHSFSGPSHDGHDEKNANREIATDETTPVAAPVAVAPVAPIPVAVAPPAPVEAAQNAQPLSDEAQKVIEREQALKRQVTQAPTEKTEPRPVVKKEQIVELVEAASIGDLRRVQSLIFDEGVDPNSKTIFGETPLLAASTHGQLTIVRLLVDKGVKVNAADPDGNTPLMRAVRGGHLKIVQFLVFNGASTRMRNNKGDTALRLATRWGRQPIVNFLQGAGSNPANRKRTPAQKH